MNVKYKKKIGGEKNKKINSTEVEKNRRNK